MAMPKMIEVCQQDLFTSEKELQERYDSLTIGRLLRIRDEYQQYAQPFQPALQRVERMHAL